MKTSLDYKNNFLCVLAEFEFADGRQGNVLKEWYPIIRANEGEVGRFVGRPVTAIDSGEGTYIDEEGNIFQLASGGKTNPLEVERTAAEGSNDIAGLLEASLLQNLSRSPTAQASQKTAAENHHGKRIKVTKRKKEPILGGVRSKNRRPLGPRTETEPDRDVGGSGISAPLSLRQKLALVRRRLGYVQKRGHNELHNYTYVTAADLAGAVGDILAELGILVVPRLESISHESVRNYRSDGEHLTHVVMSYSFVDVDTAEDITVKVAGEGVDAGDKAPYKAMTGALKYALLQSFLLATGDDPEDERPTMANHSSSSAHSSEQLITTGELHELQQMIEETNTELERVLAYYKLSSLEQMTEGTYRRAVDLLKQKKARQNREANDHAPN